jgi:hypothetical protein
MSDFAVTQFEPIVQGVMTIAGGGGALTWEGVGLEAIERAPGFAFGAYILTLDEGLPGNAGAVPPGILPVLNPDVRSLITVRGPAPPAVNPIQTSSVLYVHNLPGVGSTALLIVMADDTNTLNDPLGFELQVYRVFNG